MAIYRYTDRVSYRDTVLYKYRNIKMSYSKRLMLLIIFLWEVNILYLSESNRLLILGVLVY